MEEGEEPLRYPTEEERLGYLEFLKDKAVDPVMLECVYEKGMREGTALLLATAIHTGDASLVEAAVLVDIDSFVTSIGGVEAWDTITQLTE